MAHERTRSPASRTHVVLVPGFVGFDALGQLEYYAGVTGEFNEWRRATGTSDVALHYFDNFPTASVELRAHRLQRFLAKRIARGIFGERDRIALVGHSTGGLDIRRTLYSLGTGEHHVMGDTAPTPQAPAPARPQDSSRSRAYAGAGPRMHVDNSSSVAHGEVLGRVERVVFLSTPHYGTNIADFACRFDDTAMGLTGDAAWGVERDAGVVARVRRALTSTLADSKSGLLLAIIDALNESDEFAASEEDRAAEREARAHLLLWLGHMSRDFRIVQDLRSYGEHTARGLKDLSSSTSPAHYGPDVRRRELEIWKGIRIQSYATHVPGPLVRCPRGLRQLVTGLQSSAPVVDLTSKLLSRVPPSTAVALGPALASTAVLLNHEPRLLFELCHALCADPTGMFQRPAPAAIVPSVVDLGSGKVRSTETLAVEDSDGIVNTLSMCWPHEPAAPGDRTGHPECGAHPVFLVEGDHGDIIGHYVTRRVPPANGAPGADCVGRRYEAYDFFDAGFQFQQFSLVWRGIFDFCAA
jgi:hypothetical protein